VVSCAADPVAVVHQQQPDGTIVEKFLPAAPDIREVEKLLDVLMLEAEATLRVRARELAIRTSNRVGTFLRDRLR
jgi:hypothetical protein